MSGKTTFAQSQLRSLVERIERLEEEKKTIAGDIQEVYAEAKANGFDTKILRKVISHRARSRLSLALYLAALGMQPDFFDGDDNPSKNSAAQPAAM